MSDEISITVQIAGAKGGTTVSGAVSLTETLTGEGLWANTQTIGESAWEALSFPSDLTAEGMTYLYAKNNDPDNFVQVALDNAGAHIFGKLKAGQPMLIPVYDGAPVYYAKADTADVDLKMVAVGT